MVEAEPTSSFVCLFPRDTTIFELIQNTFVDQPFLVKFCHLCFDEWADLSIDADHPDATIFEDFGEKVRCLNRIEQVRLGDAVILVLSIGRVLTDRAQVVVGGVDLVVREIDVIALYMCTLWVSEPTTCVSGGATILHTHVAKPKVGCAWVHTFDHRRCILEDH